VSNVPFASSAPSMPMVGVDRNLRAVLGLNV